MHSRGKAQNQTAEGRPAPRPGHCALAGLIILATLMTAACGEKNTFVAPPPPKVTVSQAVKQPVTDYLEFTGNTQAINSVQLKARVEGYLEKIFFKDGDQVKKGQLLFLIQENTYEAKLQQAEAEILSQKAKLFHAQTEYARFTKLVSPEGRGPDGRGQLALPAGCGQGCGHVGGGATGPGPAQPELHQGDGAL